MERILIIGAGQAGLQLAASLRQAGFPGRVTLLGAEAHPPYQRPPLSKAYLQGDLAPERLALRPPEFFDRNAIDLRLGAVARAVDLQGRRVTLADGGTLDYDKLALTTGAPARRLACPGAELPGVLTLRTIDDSDALRAVLARARRLAVLGAGYIGLEVAASARKAGLDVVVLEAQDRPLARVAGAEVARYFVDLHRRHGVAFRFGAKVVAIRGEAAVRAVTLEDGETIACEAVVVGVGAAPATALAAEAGLVVDDGVVVDAEARTSDPAVWAAGDCANFPSSLYGRRLRLESAPNAIDQAKAAALSMIGKPQPYDPTPWFWSDQYDVKLQTAGLCQGADASVVRHAGGAKSVWYFHRGRLIAVDCMNDAAAFAVGRKLVTARARPDPAAIADPATDLRTLREPASSP